MTATKKDFKVIYDKFSAPIAKKLDCGRICAPLNDGIPVCCSTENAIPIVEDEEWKLLNSRTDLWKPFEPFDKASKKIVKELAKTTCAIECKGVAFCERDNRSLACRSFPYFPYFTKEGELIGLATYWTFEDRCWVISNVEVADKKFVSEMIEAYEYLFDVDEEQYEAYYEESATMRRVFSKRNEPIQIIGCGMKYFFVLPKSGGRVIPTEKSAFRPVKPFTSDKVYKKAIKEAGGDPTGHSLPR